MLKRLMLIAALAITPILAQAEPFSIAPVTNPAEVANYPLNADFLAKMEAIRKDMDTLPDEPNAPDTGYDNSIEGMTATVTGKPRLTALLKKNGLEPRDYVLGSMALSAAFAAATASEDQEQIFDESQAVSKDNLEFAKKNIDRIRTVLGN